MEQRIEIESGNGQLEGILSQNSETKSVVITHPHPLYGGNMNNSVVYTIASAYQSKNYTTLRFNFRGVDGSTGTYDNGLGEQDDLDMAINFLSELGMEQIDLAGYSFGAWVIFNLAIKKGLKNRITMVSPPIDFMPFEQTSSLNNLQLVVAGDKDEFAASEKLQSSVPGWNHSAKLEIIKGIDHFYSAGLNKLSQILISSL